MTVAQLYNVPRTSAEISIWSFANRDSHNLIVQALQTKKNTTGLLTFVLDPLPTVDYSNFLLRHQLMHNQMDAVLHIGGNDFTGINFDDPQSLQFLWFLHANEHTLAHARLGING